jgi:hypothetical protein
MKLYLHIGTEKTGSSHLQSMSAINRTILQQNGIWFPSEGKNDALLVKGEISAGNAQSLTDALHTNNLSACESFVAQRVEETIQKSCHSLFLSNELLLIALAKDNKLNQFVSMLKKMGISDVKFLLFLRDPVNHALSLYKHRAKNGNALDIEEWPKKHYVYGGALVSFLEQAQLEKINLETRKFSKEKGALEKILFKEWLNIQEDLIPPPKIVNPSLSLSELILLKKVRQHQPYLVNVLYGNLIKINKKDKCENSSIEQYHKQSLSNQIVNYRRTWKICNQFLPVDEKIAIPQKSENQLSISDKNSSFSDQQMEAIAGIISDSLGFKFKFQIAKLKIKAQILKLLRALKLKN